MIEFPDLPRRQRSEFEVQSPNYGVYLGVPELQVPDRGMLDCMNVRIRDRKITNRNVGYELHHPNGVGGQVLLIDLFTTTSGSAITIYGTKSDLFRYDSVSNAPLYITPMYTTGTVGFVDASPTVTGTATSWTSADVKIGDYIHRGTAGQDDPEEDWFEIIGVDIGAQTLTLADNFVGTFPGQVYTIRQTFTASDADYWDSDVFPDAPLGTHSGLAAGDHWIASSGSELVVWDGIAANVVDITTAIGFTCKTVSYYKNMMIYGYLLEGGTIKPGNFKNSAIADPENVTTLEANEYTLVEGVDFIEAIVPLGDYLVGYATNSIAIAQFVSLPVFFAIRTVAPGIGVYSGRLVMDYGDYHEILSTDRAYRFDGVSLQPFGGHVFSETLQTADRSRASKGLAFLSEEELETYWCVPLSTDGAGDNKSAEIGLVEHYAEPVPSGVPTPFTKRSLPATAAGYFVTAPVGRFSDFPGLGFDDVPFRMNDSFFTSEFPVVLFGDEDGNIWKMNTASAIGSDATYQCFFSTPTRPLAGGSDLGIIRRIEPYVEKDESSGLLNIWPVTTDRVAGDYQSGVVQGVEIDHGGSRFVSNRVPGRYGRVLFFTNEINNTWTMQGYRVTVERLGER